jgi:hypothetical protein
MVECFYSVSSVSCLFNCNFNYGYIRFWTFSFDKTVLHNEFYMRFVLFGIRAAIVSSNKIKLWD